MNERDSEFVMGLLAKEGFRKADSPEDADVVLFNTCSVRKHAEHRAISNMGALLKRKKKALFGIIGCSAQALKADLFKKLPNLDIVCGPGRIYELPFLIKQAEQSKVFACDNINRDLPEVESDYREDKEKGFVSIMRGCDNYCSYCIVPYVRGRERSRRPEGIIKEIEGLVGRGIKEITLLGQNVNSYKSADCDFVALLGRINNIKGIKKIKFMTSHPKNADVRLFEAIKGLDKVAKELHMPLQSGSDRILELMNRGYTSGKYTTLIKDLRRLVPNCRISTDFITGFPTETEKDFKESLNLMKELEFDAAYIFKYSPRKPAKASFLEDDVTLATKQGRHKKLLDLQRKISKSK